MTPAEAVRLLRVLMKDTHEADEAALMRMVLREVRNILARVEDGATPVVSGASSRPRG